VHRQDHTVLVAVENARVRERVLASLHDARYSPKVLAVDELLRLEPTFGPNAAVFIFLHAGPDRERMHAVAQHLYDNWSEQGFVLLIVYHPEGSTDEDLFRIWALDALWKFRAPQQLVTVNRSVNDRGREIRDDVRSLAYWTGEMTTETRTPSRAERRPWWKFWQRRF
jgi:hypothetical protein